MMDMPQNNHSGENLTYTMNPGNKNPLSADAVRGFFSLILPILFHSGTDGHAPDGNY